MIQQNDANKDGKLSKDEVPEPRRDFFDQIDADKDGFITAAELQSGMRGMGAGAVAVESADRVAAAGGSGGEEVVRGSRRTSRGRRGRFRAATSQGAGAGQ
ncbi:MAG: hypothetical protein U0992_21085 [Planctomycetaceae bacterium]